MFPASCTMGGMCQAFPDVCKTPSPGGPVPIPYPNISQVPMATGTAKKVQLSMMPGVTLKSKISLSNGDEAGSLGGVVSGVFINQTQFSKGSMKVMFEGSPVVHLTSMTRQNGSNANMPAGQQIAPSQVKVIVGP
jgi:hypothetical protein